MADTTSSGTVVDITRVFNAPVEKVWRAWTEPEQLMRWTGPKSFTCPSFKTDFRVGGKYVFCMRMPDGKNIYAAGIYKEIIPLKKIEYSDSFSDENGNVVSPQDYGMDANFPEELTISITFEEENGKTKMHLTQWDMPENEKEMCTQGWQESFDKLEQSLK